MSKQPENINFIDPMSLANKLGLDDFYILIASIQNVHLCCHKIKDDKIRLDFTRAVFQLYKLLKRYFDYD